MAYKKVKPKEKREKKVIKLVDDCFQYLDRKLDEAIDNVTQWEERQAKWYRLRMRIKKAKTSPFVGCSNIRMPTAEIKIRKLKAALVNTVVGIRPVVQVIPSPSGSVDTAKKIEKFLDHLIMDVIGLTKKAIVAIDQELEKGFYLLKPYWKLEITRRIEKFSKKDLSEKELLALTNSVITEEQIKNFLIEKLEVDTSDWVAKDNDSELSRVAKEVLSGKDEIQLTLKDVLYNAPDIMGISPERAYVPSDSPLNPQECEFICHEFFLPYYQVRVNAEQKDWSKEAVEEIEYWKGKDKDKIKSVATRDETSSEWEKSIKEGIDRINSTSEQVRIWEWYGWYDINGDGVPEKCVITAAPDFNVILRKITLPFSNGKFPFVKLCYEITDDRWFAHRGIPELLEDIIKEIDVQHMQKIDSQTIRNAPMFAYRAGMINPNLVKFIPGQGIPIQGMQPLNDSLMVLNNNNPNTEFSYEKEQMILETKVEELIGQVDFTLQSMINKRQPRTLGEVQMQQQNMQMVFSLDATMNTEAFSELFTMIWDLWCQYGDDQYEFSYFGKDGWEPIRLTREEVQGKYKVVVRGNDQNTNPQVRLQKAQMVMMAMQNPMAAQMGVIKPWHLAEGYDLLFKELDLPEHQRLHEDSGELYKQFQQQQQNPPPLPVKVDMDDLADGEKAQVVQRMGLEPDMTERAIQTKLDIHAKEDDSRVKRAKAMKDTMSMVGEIKAQEEAKVQEHQERTKKEEG
ncbi:MAG TPA: hypothetical protein PLE33_08695 [Candidatus Cloacimonas sp.]|nr:hypothetical protein [Candidatus Cloacimonas sp.]HPS61319.1 hypothetical protein [Candidatus Cloacimonas sp.]